MSPISQTSLFSVYLFSRASHQYKWQMKVRNSARASVSTVKWTSKKTRKKDDVFFFWPEDANIYIKKTKHSACKISTEIQQIHHRVNDRPQWQMVCVCVYMSFFLGHPACLCIWAADTVKKHFIKVSSGNTLKHRKGACLSAAHHSTKITPIIIHWCFQTQYVYQFKHPGGIPGAHPGLFSSGPSAP